MTVLGLYRGTSTRVKLGNEVTFSPCMFVCLSCFSLMCLAQSRESNSLGQTKLARHQGMIAAYMNIIAIIVSLVLAMLAIGLSLGIHLPEYYLSKCKKEQGVPYLLSVIILVHVFVLFVFSASLLLLQLLHLLRRLLSGGSCAPGTMYISEYVRSYFLHNIFFRYSTVAIEL